MKHQFTSVIEKRGKWYVAYIEEIPGVNTQGKTLAEARRNLKEALAMVVEANRELAATPSIGIHALVRQLAFPVTRKYRSFSLEKSVAISAFLTPNGDGTHFNKYSCRNSTVV